MTQPATQSQSDGELFATIENGIRLTGMPAWGDGSAKSAPDTWALVHFIRHLPQLTPEEAEAMKALNPARRRSMTRRTAVLAAVLLMAPMVGLAHEGHEHKLMGTVTAVQADGNRVEIKTVKGERAAFLLSADTKFLEGTSAAARTALSPGTRVVAEGKMVDNVLVATTVRIGGAAETAAPKASPRPAAHPH